MRRLSLPTLLLAASLFASARARAADPNDARLAQALFEEARQLMAQKRYAEACPKLEESQRRDPGGGTLLNLALCHESEGKIATAYVEYTESLALATRDGRRDRQDFARTHLATLEGNVPRLTVLVRPEALVAGLEVAFDGTTLPEAAWGVATPVDPGAHVVTATAPGRTQWTTTVSLLAGEKKTVQVTAPSATPTTTPTPAPTPPPPPNPTATPTANPVFYATLGVGSVAAITTVVTGVMALSAQSDAKDGCIAERSFCRDAASRDAAESAGTYAWVSTGALVISVAAFGALLFIPSRRTAAPQVGIAFDGAGVRGTF